MPMQERVLARLLVRFFLQILYQDFSFLCASGHSRLSHTAVTAIPEANLPTAGLKEQFGAACDDSTRSSSLKGPPVPQHKFETPESKFFWTFYCKSDR